MRYFTELAYNGKNYFGWQIQPNQISIQETVENAFSTLLRKEIKITGCGRTDTGVHAKSTYAHFDFEDDLPEDIVHRMNSFLPNDISIYRIFSVNNDAHARFDASKRTYQYFAHYGKNPFEFDFSLRLHKKPDLAEMNLAAVFLIGKKDFSSFAKTRTDVKTHICEVYSAKWTENNNRFIFEISADRFLRDMVRSIVGTLIDVGIGKITTHEFKEIIEKKDRRFAGGSAAAHGLYLVDVEYPKTIFSNE